LRAFTNLTDPVAVHHFLGAIRGEHAFTKGQRLFQGAAQYLFFGVGVPFALISGLTFGMPAPWPVVGILLGALISLFAGLVTWDHINSRFVVTDHALSRVSPFRWASWSLPLGAIQRIRIRRNRSGLILTVVTGQRSRALWLPPDLTRTVSEITGA
jgi:hypothetical protein